MSPNRDGRRETAVFVNQVMRDVVEDVVAREALGLSVEDARDELIAARVVVEELGRQADR